MNRFSKVPLVQTVWVLRSGSSWKRLSAAQALAITLYFVRACPIWSFKMQFLMLSVSRYCNLRGGCLRAYCPPFIVLCSDLNPNTINILICKQETNSRIVKAWPRPAFIYLSNPSNKKINPWLYFVAFCQPSQNRPVFMNFTTNHAVYFVQKRVFTNLKMGYFVWIHLTV